MFRFICVVAFLTLYLILGVPVLLMEWLLGFLFPSARDYSSLRIVQWGFRTILKLSGVTATVIGEERIPKEPVLFIANHRSLFDIHLTYSRCKNLTGYVAKKEMLRYPLLRTWMKRLYCLFLDRSTPKEGLKTILKAIEYIKNGVSVCIFPEGTRNDGEELSLLPFHDGSFKIATKAGCPIVPISLNNTHAIFEEQFPRIKKTHVVIEYGDPIYPHKLDKRSQKHLGEYCRGVIKETLERNRSLV